MAPPFVGQSVTRKEGRAKVTGAARYADDVTFPDMLFGVTVRSTIAHGTIRTVTFGDGIPWETISIVAARDIPGTNRVALIDQDQPFLADGVVNHAEEPILLLAHHDMELLERARAAVQITYGALPATLSIEGPPESLRLLKSYELTKGTIDHAWASAHRIVEGEYHTEAQEHVYIEPQGIIAIANSTDGVTVWGSLQCPYYIHKALLPLFGLPPDKVRIVQTETGGGFGGKDEYPSIIAGHAALLAWKSGKPVKMIYDRAEDMAATTKRHPSRTRIKSAVDADGKLQALDIDFTIDAGAYTTLSPVVLSRGTLHAAGPYACPNVRIRARAVATHYPPHGAFRGFGAPQSVFAIERHMDGIAKTLGVAPEEFRRRNFIRDGETLACGQLVRDGVDMPALLARAMALSGYQEKYTRFRAENPTGPMKRGIGLAAFMHGAGFTGAGERYLASRVAVEATPEGCVRVLTANTEIGQGTYTVFSQIAADALGVAIADIDVVTPDTALVPNSGPTVASRTTMIVGDLVGTACRRLRDTVRAAGLLGEQYFPAQFRRACADYIAQHGALRAEVEYTQPPNIHWDEERYRGDAYATYAWAVYVAEVHVDTTTCEIRVEDFTAVQEVGRVVNPVLAAGQIEGGVAQGIGYALYEKVCWREGRMVNNSLTNYIIPTAMDVPRVRVHFEEVPYVHGFSGAKGIGELPLDGAAPAILSAVEHATGHHFTRIPLMPEECMAALAGC